MLHLFIRLCQTTQIIVVVFGDGDSQLFRPGEVTTILLMTSFKAAKLPAFILASANRKWGKR